MKEEVDKELNVAAVLTENVAALTSAIQSLNAVVLVLLYNQKLEGLTYPDWKDKKTVERCVGEELEKCINLVNNLKEEVEVDAHQGMLGEAA